MSVSVYPLMASGVFGTFGYFVVDDESQHALLIDPGAQPQLFEQAAAEKGWTVEKILLTHGHFDHFGAADALRQAWGVDVYASRISPRYLEDPRLNLSAEHGMRLTLQGTKPLEEGDQVALDAAPGVVLSVLHVPGHTEDSLVYVLNGAGIAFVGDVVYEGGPGLTVFPTGNGSELAQSIRQKVFALPDDTALLSGHSQPITVADLKRVMGAR